MAGSPNHPNTPHQIKVDPIKDLKAIRTIKNLLQDKPRDLCLFVTGINTNLRASDLLRITAGMVRGCKPGDEIELQEKKTGKVRRITLNKAVVGAVQGLLASRQYQDEEPLFIGQKGASLRVESQFTGWSRAGAGQIGLKGNYGSHTLRKTWGCHQRVTYGVGFLN